jgi:hypothetical protein
LRAWLHQLLADLQRVNGPITAQVLADEMKVKLAELERAGADWFKVAPAGGR